MTAIMGPRVRTVPTVMIPRGTESQTCLRCETEKDVLEFRVFWYQPIKLGKPFGEKIRKRTTICNGCVKKQKKSKTDSLA